MDYSKEKVVVLMADEDYELLPQRMISGLQSDVEALRKKLTEPDAKANELILEIESLKDSIHELNVVFEKALEEMKEEDLGKILKTVQGKLDTVVAQNETIARGMIAISDKLEDFMQRQGRRTAETSSFSPQPLSPPAGSPVRHTMGQPPMSGPGRVAPQPLGMPQEGPANFPPPPPPAKKRVGLFK